MSRVSRLPRKSRSLGTLAVLIAAATLTGCSTAPKQVIIPPAAVSASTTETPSVFKPGDTILQGMDVAGSPDDWQIGDQLLLGLRVIKPGRETVRFLHIELLDRHDVFPSHTFRAEPAGRPPVRIDAGAYATCLTLYDENAQVLDTEDGRFPDAFMGYGLYDGAAPCVGRPRLPGGGIDLTGVGDEQAAREIRGWLSLFSFSTSLGRKGMFNALVKDVIARPSLFSLLFNRSISLGMGEETDFVLSEWTPARGVAVEGVAVPLTCSIGEKLGAVARIHAVRPVAPLGLSGGVVSVVGNNADKPDIRFEVRLLAAKRGGGGRAFRPLIAE